MKNLKRSFAVVCDRPTVPKEETVESYYAAGNAMLAQGDFEGGIGAYDRVLALLPNHSSALFNRAYALASTDRHSEAVDAYRSIASSTGEFPWLPLNLGVSLIALERLEEARKAFEWAVRVRPEDPIAQGNLGGVLGRLRRPEEAADALRRAMELAPRDLPTRLNLVRALVQIRSREAIDVAATTVQLALDNADAWRTLGDALTTFGEPKPALQAYTRAHAIDPTCTLRDASGYGHALGGDGQLDQAIEFYDRYLIARPEDAEAWGHLAIAHATTGHLAESLACFDQALAIEPCLPAVHSNRLVIMSYGAEATPAVMLAEAKKWAARNVLADSPFPAYASTSGRRLRIGYVSGDFREHPVGRFVAQILASHDRERFEIFGYSNFYAEDAVSAEVKQGVDHWRPLSGRSDETFAEAVREDRIDLLIDLNGHTPHNRLAAFGRRLAPVQASWLGYFGTTGLDEMDFVLADDILLPPSEEAFYTERPARVSGGLYYIQKPNLPITPNPLPALTAGRVTFGCFNMTTKITRETVALWAEVLRALPDSRMILNPHGISTVRMRNLFAEMFAEQGIDADRVDLLATSGREAYFEAFHHVDVMLDTIPFGGGTTTSEALWMGVPVVSLSSDRFPGRMSESVLRTVGLPEMIPVDRSAYVQMAVDLASDLPRLAGLRETLRAKVEGSRLCDVKAYTREIEATFEWMWANRKGA